jgi:hypothetical protein
MNPITNAALRHARAGRPVFPCWPSKQPRTPRGFRDATTDPETIQRWFSADDAVLAVPTGRASGLVVLDVDGHLGWESLRDLEQAHESLPRTASVKTPSVDRVGGAGARRSSGGPAQRFAGPTRRSPAASQRPRPPRGGACPPGQPRSVPPAARSSRSGPRHRLGRGRRTEAPREQVTGSFRI